MHAPMCRTHLLLFIDNQRFLWFCLIPDILKNVSDLRRKSYNHVGNIMISSWNGQCYLGSNNTTSCSMYIHTVCYIPNTERFFKLMLVTCLFANYIFHNIFQVQKCDKYLQIQWKDCSSWTNKLGNQLRYRVT